MPKIKQPRIKYNYSKERALKTLLDRGYYDDWNKYENDVKTTEAFIISAFDDYEGKNKLESVNFAFCIPTRASRFSEEYWEEVYDFMPALRNMKIHQRFIILSSMPPFKVEMYGKPGEESHGVVIFVPIFSDMLKDYRNRFLLRQKVVKCINDATDFAHRRMNVEYIGLGATLPKLTDFGRNIKTRVVTTTGHAGTVWLIQRTFQKVVAKYFGNKPDTLRVGFIGAGSIGMAALEKLGAQHNQTKFWVYDIRPKMNQAAKAEMKQLGIDLTIAKSNDDLIAKCDIVVSAITSRINVKNMNLTGKVIIDDSQPGQFVRREVEKAGGVLVWVVGRDGSATGFASRRSGYSYGVNGLNSASDLWGCEAEVAAIAFKDAPELAVEDHVTPEQVERVGQIFEELNIEVADFQSYGKLNDM